MLLVLAITIAYRKAWHAGYIWDDDVYVTENKLLTAPDGLRRIWFSLDSPSQYFPLVYTTFRLEHALWGLNSVGYHAVNILLHIANALLVWRLLFLLRVPGPWLAAALFALHPVQVESVAWITERKNVLMGFFFLLTLLSWIAFVEGKTKARWKSYGIALAFYALALFSKTTACTLPAALFLISWLKQKPITRQRSLQIVPFVVFGIAMGLVTVWWERYHQGTQGEIFALGVLERILLANHALWFYVSKLLWPLDLSFSYPRWPISIAYPISYIWILLTALAAAAIYWARRYLGRNIEVGAVFFVATLSPTLGFLMLYTFRFSFVADHYQYLACIGPLALAAGAITTGADFLDKKSSLLPIVGSALLLSLGGLTWRQCAMYADSKTLWRATIARNPTSWMAYNNLGTTLLKTNRVDEAVVYFNKALEIDPQYVVGYNNLGNALLRIGRLDESFAQLQKALEINPRNAEAHNNIGNTLVQMGRMDDAIAHYKRALEIDPKYAEAENNLGALFLQIGRVEDSFVHLQKALTIDPEKSAAHSNLGNALTRMGRIDEAIAEYNKALEITPDDANTQNNLAWLLATSPETRIRNGAKAVELAQRADRLTAGGNPVISATLAAAYAETGRFPDAVKTAKRAFQLATSSGNTALADSIRVQIELYQSSLPSRDKRHGPVPR